METQLEELNARIAALEKLVTPSRRIAPARMLGATVGATDGAAKKISELPVAPTSGDLAMFAPVVIGGTTYKKAINDWVSTTTTGTAGSPLAGKTIYIDYNLAAGIMQLFFNQQTVIQTPVTGNGTGLKLCTIPGNIESIYFSIHAVSGSSITPIYHQVFVGALEGADESMKIYTESVIPQGYYLRGSVTAAFRHA